MLQRVLLSIVLALAVGANASLLCKAWWCHPAAGDRGCHHEEPSNFARLVADAGCNDIVIGAAITREYLRPGLSDGDTADAVAVVPYRFVHSTTDFGSAHQSWRVPPLGRRPLLTVLRI